MNHALAVSRPCRHVGGDGAKFYDGSGDRVNRIFVRCTFVIFGADKVTSGNDDCQNRCLYADGALQVRPRHPRHGRACGDRSDSDL